MRLHRRGYILLPVMVMISALVILSAATAGGVLALESVEVQRRGTTSLAWLARTAASARRPGTIRTPGGGTVVTKVSGTKVSSVASAGKRAFRVEVTLGPHGRPIVWTEARVR